MRDDAASNSGTADEARGDSQRVRGDSEGVRGDSEGVRGDSQRVEQFFEQWGRRVGRLVTGAAARAREEAEDIFAEAQRIRRGEPE
jgi:hypothetical protein